MATTLAARFPGASFTTPTFGFGIASPHRDWGPGPTRNPDEIMAAIAISQLAKSHADRSGIEPQASSFPSLGGVPLTMSSLYKLSGGVTINNEVQETDVKSEISSNHCEDKRNIDFNKVIIVKPEPSDNPNEFLDDNKARNKASFASFIENSILPRHSATGEGQYVRTCQQTDIGGRCWEGYSTTPTESFKPIDSLTIPSTRSLWSFTDSDRKRVLSPHRTQNKVPKESFNVDQYAKTRADFKLDSGSNFSSPKSSDKRSPMTLFASDSIPKIEVTNGVLDRYNISPKASRKLDNSSQKYRLSPYSMGEPVSAARKHILDRVSQQSYDSPTGYLRMRAQHTIDQARKRYPSDDGGLVRNRIMEGSFGSLSAIEAYIKQLDGFHPSRSMLDDIAIDLSVRNRVNNPLLSDADITIRRPNSANVLPQVYDRTGRDTPELTVAFKQCDITNSKPAADRISQDTLGSQLLIGLKPCRSEPYSLCDLGNVRSDNLFVPHANVPKFNNQYKTITQHKSAENVNSALIFEQSASEPKQLKFQSENSTNGNGEEKRGREEIISRKSKSPTFHLPDSQLPPKKRRMFDQSWIDDSVEDLQKTEKPSFMETASNDKGQIVEPGVHVSDGLLSAVRADEDGDLPLHIAVVQGKIGTIERLITVMQKLKISIDSCNYQKQTALHLAVITNQLEAVDLLLDHSASPHLTDRQGNGLLHLTVKHNSVAALSRVLHRCAAKSEPTDQGSNTPVDLNIRNFEGITPLQMAVQCGSYDSVKLLLEAGADVNTQEGKNGRTALYFAAEKNDLRVAKLLLENGADPALSSYSGCTPAQAATGLNRLEIAQLLDSYNALNR